MDDFTAKTASLFFGLVQPTLRTLRYFEWAAQNLKRENLQSIYERLLSVKAELENVSPLLDVENWPSQTSSLREPLAAAIGHALSSLSRLDQLRVAVLDTYALYRTLGAHARVSEELYPLAATFEIVHRHFLDDRRQGEPLDRFNSVDDAQAGVVGIHHVENAREQKGGFSVYVPESYDPEKRYPIVFALHGGSGHGARFFWSWLRTARSEKLILVSPTSVGSTWALMSEDRDSPNLLRILNGVKELVNLDSSKILLTGMSDGGTFGYVSGLQEDSPFTHLAPCSASFHPMLIEMSSPERIRNLPVFITHGVLDEMFGVDVARTAEYVLSASGARVTYREIEDLAHRYPAERNPEVVDWFLSTDA